MCVLEGLKRRPSVPSVPMYTAMIAAVRSRCGVLTRPLTTVSLLREPMGWLKGLALLSNYWLYGLALCAHPPSTSSFISAFFAHSWAACSHCGGTRMLLGDPPGQGQGRCQRGVLASRDIGLPAEGVEGDLACFPCEMVSVLIQWVSQAR